ncbi:MAG: Modification methylase MjaV [Methanomethylovorans sp. PtaU1.Bin073]|nr:MAG: Modification methylase MjaV [Methanomethylovorans sp. PtaU1.Bin073]
MVDLAINNLYCKIICGDCKEILPTLAEKADLIVTSPPYADARKKHYDSSHPDLFAEWMLEFSKPFYDALKEDGSFVLNIKERVVNGKRHRYVWNTIIGFEKAGWIPIEDYIWHKVNPMPGYWPTRLRDGWEYCFHLAKVKKPYMDQDAVKVPIGNWNEVRLANLNGKSAERHNSENDSGFGRDLRNWVGKKMVLPSNVISLPLVGKNYGHPAVFPKELPSFFIKLFSKENGLVIDPFGGSGSTAIAAINLHRNSIIIDNNELYCKLAYERIMKEAKINGTEVIPVNFQIDSQ